MGGFEIGIGIRESERRGMEKSSGVEEIGEAEERKRKKEKISLNERGERNLIKFFFLALSDSAHLSIDMYYSNEAKKKVITLLLDGGFLCFDRAKIPI